MLSRTVFRSAVLNRALLLRSAGAAPVAGLRMCQPLVSLRKYSSHHDEETFEEFTARYEKEFEEAYDLFEVQRVLNNCFSYDLVPAPVIIEKALRAARRVNDLPTAIRVFEALKYKVENEEQYQAYLEELSEVRKELGVPLKEELFPESS
ncbi:ACL110Wp [Eremothecium gossypii ATCC 10895]|uniref:Cytochrome c oxidase subunit 6, mitochondrial n=1 Tax=Eremothecium gossypii (strain ATCC 10895 / CBS 109.51 / FGSC 9923 / NRRL Y-1056) TaxID=284811 RepID=Q75CM9_EREGS|nr:ACL110Wp [Eremothecium gossypii ATCC 10895]AAS51118.1 ACL110Wp [Eremothecium gossypii ATCC 10895]AEY95408.1 FACL110Wp [Eremothecium gossypii FDAG1]